MAQLWANTTQEPLFRQSWFLFPQPFPNLSPHCVPGAVLKTLHTLAHFKLHNSPAGQTKTFKMHILQGGNLKHRDHRVGK